MNDGWFHTGDIGTLVDGRFLKITDRKKEIFKTSGGKYIAPQAIENKFKESNFIEQIMVIGENQKYASALIVPDFNYLKNSCNQSGISFSNNSDIIKNDKVLTAIRNDVAMLNKEFGNTEQIKKIKLVDKEWTIDGGELTATLKLKRKKIAEKYMTLIEEIYNEEPLQV